MRFGSAATCSLAASDANGLRAQIQITVLNCRGLQFTEINGVCPGFFLGRLLERLDAMNCGLIWHLRSLNFPHGFIFPLTRNIITGTSSTSKEHRRLRRQTRWWPSANICELVGQFWVWIRRFRKLEPHQKIFVRIPKLTHTLRIILLPILALSTKLRRLLLPGLLVPVDDALVDAWRVHASPRRGGLLRVHQGADLGRDQLRSLSHLAGIFFWCSQNRFGSCLPLGFLSFSLEAF